ncbi:MAG: hypothetical protein LBD79_04525 [Treponema sp.]|jgi:hypothetical protein|nr:hypothetical protein [Treponema sp.]
MANKIQTTSEKLASLFLERARFLSDNIELIKVLKSRTYHIGGANVLIRVATEGANRRFFYGVNYLHIEELVNLDNPFIAFICGSIDSVVIMPAQILFAHLSQISHDRNGEYKIVFDKDFNLVLAGKNNRLGCAGFYNAWASLFSPQKISLKGRNTVEENLHSILQGRLHEIGNIRGYQTYCPNKSKVFNNKKLENIATLYTCPQLQFSDYKLLREIDVLWFRLKGDRYIPEYAFEVELSTGVWSGVGRMATLIDYANVGLFIIANDSRKYKQVLASFYDIASRYKFISNETLGDLYSAEKNLKELRYEIGL